jgi:hypothetical protein
MSAQPALPLGPERFAQLGEKTQMIGLAQHLDLSRPERQQLGQVACAHVAGICPIRS